MPLGDHVAEFAFTHVPSTLSVRSSMRLGDDVVVLSASAASDGIVRFGSHVSVVDPARTRNNNIDMIFGLIVFLFIFIASIC